MLMPWFAEGWSKPHRVTDRDVDPWFRACENHMGLYRLVALMGDGPINPATLQRVCGPDASGTLYIGSTSSLPRRLSELVRSRHIGCFQSRAYKAMPTRLAAEFPPDKLAICWRYLSDDVDRYAEERKLITAYTDVFGELPPLNAMP